MLMKPIERWDKRANLRLGAPEHREGRTQKLARRMLMTAGSTAITTEAIMRVVYPNEPWTRSRWRVVRDAAALGRV